MYKYIYIIILLLLLTSCRATRYASQTTDSTEVAVPITNTTVEYRNRLVHDSIYNHDSVYVYIKGDTVFKYKEKIAFRCINKTDTLLRTDTIKVPVVTTKKVIQKVTETKEVNKMYWWQKCFMWIGIALFLFCTSLLVVSIKKHF